LPSESLALTDRNSSLTSEAASLLVVASCSPAGSCSSNPSASTPTSLCLLSSAVNRFLLHTSSFRQKVASKRHKLGRARLGGV